MAVGLVTFARRDPIRCLWAALFFGGAGARAPALQPVGNTTGHCLIAAVPCVLTPIVLILTCSPWHGLVGAPNELFLND